MKYIKLLFLSFIAFLFTTSNIYSQYKRVNELLKNNSITPNPNSTKEFNPDILKTERIKNQLNKIIYTQNFDSTSVVDSVIIINIRGELEKHSYYYDTDNRIAVKLLEMHDGYNWYGYWRYSYTYDSNGNTTSEIKEHGSNELVVRYKKTFTYDSDGYISHYLHEVLGIDSLVNSSEYYYEHDSRGNMTMWSGHFWMNNEWVKNWVYTYAYDLNGNSTSFLHERFDGDSLLSSIRKTYTYDSMGNLLTQLREEGLENNLKNTKLEIYTYDSNENIILELLQDWNGIAWINYHRYTSGYNSDGNIISYVKELWDETDWRKYSRRLFEYDSEGNSILEKVESSDLGVDWRNTAQYVSEFDSNGNLTFWLFEMWSNNSWLSYYRNNYAFNASGGVVSASFESWDGAAWIERNGTASFYDSFGRYFYYNGPSMNMFYSTLTSVNDSKPSVVDYTLSQNYPNPFNPSTTIQYSIPSNVKSGIANVSLKIYDVLGREVATLVNKEQSEGNYEVQFNASSLTSGIYFYKLQSGNFVESRKMMLIK